MVTELEVLSRMHEPVPHAVSHHHLTAQNYYQFFQNSIVPPRRINKQLCIPFPPLFLSACYKVNNNNQFKKKLQKTDFAGGRCTAEK